MKLQTRNKLFSFFALLAFAALLAGSVFAQPRRRAVARTRTAVAVAPAPAGPMLAASLPATDAAMTFDSGRFLKTGLPQLLAGNKSMLAEVNNLMAKVRTATGIDPNSVTSIAAGMRDFKATGASFDAEVVMLARGTFASSTLLDFVRKIEPEAVSETVNGRTVLIVKPKVSADDKAKVADKLPGGIVDKVFGGFENEEMAIGAFDDNTVVAGTPALVRAALGDGPRVGSDVLASLARKPNAMMSFVAKFPIGLAGLLPLDDDELGVTLKGIREISGSMDLTQASTMLSMAARTETPAQAENLYNTLNALKGFAGIMKTSKRSDQQVYARMIDGVKLSRTGGEVAIDATLANADISGLFTPKK